MIQSILDIQNQLKLEGYYKGSLDGIYGNQTNKAIQKSVIDNKFSLYFNFDKYKKQFNKTSISQSFVNNINVLFKAFNEYNLEGGTNPLNIAYLLGTAYHETAFTMQPIKEYGSVEYLSKYDTGRLAKVLGNTPEADGDGVFYAGRGYVMITGRDNYKKFTDLLNIDLIRFPDLTLDASVAAKILVIGSLRGSFTTKRLSDYIRTGKRLDFIRARAVINGSDKAESIAIYAEKFLECIILKKIF